MTELPDDDSVLPEDPGPPPESMKRKGEWARRFELIQSKPEKWFRVRTVKSYKSAQNLSGALRRGKVQLPDGRFEITVRPGQDGDEHGYIYARYLGPDKGGRPAKGVTRIRKPSVHRSRTTTFYQWIKPQKGTDGYLGKLATYILKDKNWPKKGPMANQYDYLHKYVLNETRGDFQVDWFEKGWEDYKAQVKGVKGGRPGRKPGRKAKPKP